MQFTASSSSIFPGKSTLCHKESHDLLLDVINHILIQTMIVQKDTLLRHYPLLTSIGYAVATDLIDLMYPVFKNYRLILSFVENK